MRRFLGEPLVHFVALGALVFAVYVARSRSAEPAPGRIVVSQGQLSSMMENFTRVRQRPPTPEEWNGLIQARVREEVLYREALALGLDQDDTIIRRRLQQKMEFISDDLAGGTPPTEAELEAYLQAHPDEFRFEPRLTFRQVFLDPARRGVGLTTDVDRLLVQLNQGGSGADLSAVGDATLLARDFSAAPAGEIARQFGAGFAARLAELSPGRWQGPVESAFGAHLVLVVESTAGRMPALAEVRDAVQREWSETRRRDVNERFYQELLAHYSVTIEDLEPAETGSAAASN